MGAAAFSKTIQTVMIDRIRGSLIEAWKSGETVLVQNKKGDAIVNPESMFSSEKLRLMTDSGKSGHESIMTQKGLERLAQQFGRLEDDLGLAAQASSLLSKDNIFKDFAEYLTTIGTKSRGYSTKNYSYSKQLVGKGAGSIKYGIPKQPDDDPFISIQNMELGTLNTYFIQYLTSKTTADPKLIAYIKSNIQAGHLSGILGLRVKNIFGLSVRSGTDTNYRTTNVGIGTGNEELKKYNDIMQKILVLIADADYISSNIVGDLSIFSRSNKQVYKENGGAQTTSEIQIGLLNKDSGAKLIGIGINLSSLVSKLGGKPGRDSISKSAAALQLDNLASNLRELAKYVVTMGKSYQKDARLSQTTQERIADIVSDSETINALLTTEGSDPMIVSYEKTIISILKTGKAPAKKVTNISSKTTVKLPNKNKKATVPVLKKPIIKNINIKQSIRSSKGQFISPVSIMSLLNSRLAQQIQNNMGKGGAKAVLNYRTGRLAESAEVVNVSNRDSAVNIFYSYMKNPYATFAPGGAQSSPASRDPNKLIQLSIRQLATVIMANRLKVVPV